MRIGLASYRVENKNTEFNISQIERAMKEAEGKADLLCFGETVLQGFDSLGWNYKKDKEMAVSLNSGALHRLSAGSLADTGFEGACTVILHPVCTFVSALKNRKNEYI